MEKPTAGPEKRGRDRTLSGASAHLLADRLTLPCTVVDLSPSGARLEIAPGNFLPRHLRLRARELGLERAVEVVWRNRTQLGVRFLG